MKRMIITLSLLAILLLAFSAPTLAESPAAPGASSHGFTVSEVSRLESLNADLVKLTHDRTGARVIFVLNDDENKGFSICFHTEPSDDTGMLHILEHAVCAASDKYPGRDVFFDAISQAYLTGLNAWTSLSSTNYYATSMDENQLEALADFYLDCAFHSALLTQPNYFYREGWRYELPSPDAELTVNGIVYNEMQGVYGNIYSAAAANVNKTLFPDTYQSRDSGGVPETIPNLSYDELIAFYQSCYNPANSVTMFYGNVNMDRFLSFLNDNYFATVEAGERAPISPGQTAFAAPVEASYDFPVAEEAEDTGACLYYAVALTEEDSADYSNYALCDVVATLLSDNSSPLMQALNASGIGSGYGAYIGKTGDQLTLYFYATDADASRKAEFKDIVLTRVEEMAKDGLNEAMLRALFASAEISLRLQRNSGNVAVTLFNNLTWIQEMGNDAPLNAAEWYRKADALCVPGYAEEKLLRLVVNNPHAALVATVPAPGLLEKNEQALRDKLAAQKAAMTDDEIKALVDETAAFAQWVQLDTPAETIEKVSVVDPATVEAAWPDRQVQTETVNGVTVRTVPSAMDMTAVQILFDLGHLTDTELCRLKMLASVMDASTEAHSQEEITMAMARLMNGFSAQVSTRQERDSYRPVFSLTWFAPNESLAESAALAFELLRATDLAANADLLAQNLDASIGGYRNPENAYNILDYTATASISGCFGLIDKLYGMRYLNELRTALTEYDEDPSGFVDGLKALRSKAFCRQNVQVMLAGDGDGLARTALLNELDKLPETAGETLPRNDLSTARSIALTGSTQASYLARGTALPNPAESVTGDKLVLCKLINGEYLLPTLRFQMGAYNASLSLSLDGVWAAMYYRGGTVFDADQAILAMPDFVESLDITQEQLDAYKLPAIAELVTPGGELNDGLSDLRGDDFGFTRERRLALAEEIRNVTVADVKALAPVLRDMLANSGLAVITSAGELSGHEDAFDAAVQLP